MSRKKIYNQTEVEYKISMYPSIISIRTNSWAYQSKARSKGTIRVYIPLLWDFTHDPKANEEVNLTNLTNGLISTIILERICLERGFQKIRTKGGACNPKKDKEGYEYPCIGQYLLYKMGFGWWIE